MSEKMYSPLQLYCYRSFKSLTNYLCLSSLRQGNNTEKSYGRSSNSNSGECDFNFDKTESIIHLYCDSNEDKGEKFMEF